MKNQLALFIISLLLVGCSDPIKKDIISQSETFRIACKTEVGLTLSNGDQVLINEDWLNCGKSDSISLTVKYLKTKKDIILSGLQTVDDQNRILESAGMFKIELPDDVSVNRGSPILYTLNTDYAYPNTNLYTLSDDQNSWELAEEDIKAEGTDVIDLGKSLFKKNCANCHSSKLRFSATGPALGRVSDYRSMEWLYDFTRNSQKLISEGDSIANCVSNSWNGQVMNSFEFLDSSEIISIYKFIKNESEVNKITIHEMIDNYDCASHGSHSIDTGTLIQYDTLGNVVRTVTTTSSGGRIVNNYKTVEKVETKFKYINKVYNNQWYNVDYFIEIENMISAPTLKIPNASQNIEAFLTFLNYNACIQFEKDGEEYKLKNFKDSETINWPENEPVLIVITELDENRVLLRSNVELTRFNKTKNDISLSLEEMSTSDFDAALGTYQD